MVEGKDPANRVENWGGLDETGLWGQRVFRRRHAVISSRVCTAGRGTKGHHGSLQAWWKGACRGRGPGEWQLMTGS